MHCVLQSLCIVFYSHACFLQHHCVLRTPCIVFCSHHVLSYTVTSIVFYSHACVLQHHWFCRHHELCSAVITCCFAVTMHYFLQSCMCFTASLCSADTMHCVLQSSRVVLYCHYALCSTVMLVFYIIVFCRHHALSCSHHGLCSTITMHCILRSHVLCSADIMNCVLQSLCIMFGCHKLFCSHYNLCSADIMNCVLQDPAEFVSVPYPLQVGNLQAPLCS